MWRRHLTLALALAGTVAYKPRTRKGRTDKDVFAIVWGQLLLKPPPAPTPRPTAAPVAPPKVPIPRASTAASARWPSLEAPLCA